MSVQSSWTILSLLGHFFLLITRYIYPGFKHGTDLDIIFLARPDVRSESQCVIFVQKLVILALE